MYTEKNTLSELLEHETVMELFEKIAPGMKDSPAMAFMKDLSLEVVMETAGEKARPTYLL